MILTNGDLLAIIIALLGSITVMGLFWRENVALRRELYRLHEEKNLG